MADEDTTEDTKTETPTKTPTETTTVPDGANNPDAVRNALNAERKAAKDASKRAEAAEARIAEFEERDKSETEKLSGKLTKAEQAVVEAEAKLMRYEVATEKSVPSEMVPLLTATSREDLEQQADLILKNAKDADATSFDSGARTTPAKSTDVSDDPKMALGSGLFQALEGRNR